MPSAAYTENANVSRYLTTMAAAHPGRAAVKIPRGRTRGRDIDYLTLSFAELETEVTAWTGRLERAGVRRGDRTLVMVRQGLPLIASAFAVFRIGAVPVIIDPGMGLKNFLRCVAQSDPRVLIGIPFAHVIGRLFHRAFRRVRIRVVASSSLTARIAPKSPGPGLGLATSPATAVATELAAILFTSGSTGAPKGVCYEHGMFEAQVRLIRSTYGIESGEIDLPLLPIFALFNPALGMTTIVPEIDPRRPAQVDPVKIVQAVRQENVTNSFGSPTLWRRIGDHCVQHGIVLPSLRRVLCAGAPVPSSLWKSSAAFLTHGRLHSPYGATEALPVATVSAPEIDLNSARGACVGQPIHEVEVRIIRVTDSPLPTMADATVLPRGEIGEIIVHGPVVTKAYHARPDATAAAKIRADDGTVWHRMGDCGYLDAAGKLWFCGRKAERVETSSRTLYTEPCEQVFREHPRAQRCALIGLGERGQQRPALVVEARLRDSAACRRLARELAQLGRRHVHTAPIDTFYFLPRFPVDVRHNAKIHRLTLARWAKSAKGFHIELKR